MIDAMLEDPRLAEYQRDWGLDEVDGTVRGLRSFFPRRPQYLYGWWGYDWTPGEQVARCLIPKVPGRLAPRFSEPHDVVDPSCTCGVYSYRLEGLPSYHADQGTVYAVINGWGNTLVGDKGFRCEIAEMVAVAPNPKVPIEGRLLFKELAQDISRFYNVPLLLDLEALLAEYPLGEYAWT